MAYDIEDERSPIGGTIHAAVKSVSPDERLMEVYRVAAEIIHANYPEQAHELLAVMAQYDVFEFLMAIYLAEDALNERHRRAA
jgi:hypothetical protein